MIHDVRRTSVNSEYTNNEQNEKNKPSVNTNKANN